MKHFDIKKKDLMNQELNYKNFKDELMKRDLKNSTSKKVVSFVKILLII